MREDDVGFYFLSMLLDMGRTIALHWGRVRWTEWMRVPWGLCSAIVFCVACRSMQQPTNNSTLAYQGCSSARTPPQIPFAVHPDLSNGQPGAGTIVGVVIDSANDCSIPAFIDLHFDSMAAPGIRGTKGIRTAADSGGGFVIRGVLPGEYFLAARLFGYGPQWQSVRVHGGEIDTVLFRLSKVTMSGPRFPFIPSKP